MLIDWLINHARRTVKPICRWKLWDFLQSDNDLMLAGVGVALGFRCWVYLYQRKEVEETMSNSLLFPWVMEKPTRHFLNGNHIY